GRGTGRPRRLPLPVSFLCHPTCARSLFLRELLQTQRQEPQQRGTLLRNSRNISDSSSILCRSAWDSRQLQWGRRDPPHSIQPQESEFENRPIFVAEGEGRHSTAI